MLWLWWCWSRCILRSSKLLEVAIWSSSVSVQVPVLFHPKSLIVLELKDMTDAVMAKDAEGWLSIMSAATLRVSIH